jgi:hypothetical protein
MVCMGSQPSVSGPLCAEALDLLKHIAGPIDSENFIYDGLVEAIKNATHHAYPADSSEWYTPCPDHWWVCGAFQTSTRKLYTSVYDAGVGIPNTLPVSGMWEEVVAVLSRLGVRSNDASLISAAMHVGRTRTDLAGRGRGLPTMMRLFDRYPGHLRVLSGRGEVIYYGNGKFDQLIHAVPLAGTLIEWQLYPTDSD